MTREKPSRIWLTTCTFVDTRITRVVTLPRGSNLLEIIYKPSSPIETLHYGLLLPTTSLTDNHKPVAPHHRVIILATPKMNLEIEHKRNPLMLKREAIRSQKISQKMRMTSPRVNLQPSIVSLVTLEKIGTLSTIEPSNIIY